MKNTKNRKIAALVLAMLMIVGCVAGGTLAWLTAKATAVTNVFTTSDIAITLVEHEYDAEADALKSTTTTTGVSNYKMIPGWTIPKDPTVTVDTDSEDCYLFVKVDESDNFTTYMTYEVAEGWTKLDSVSTEKSKVYYRVIDKEYDSASANTATNMKGVGYIILKNNKVNVKDTVTKAMMAEANGVNQPKLTFTAYAVQLWKTNASYDDPATPAVNEAQFTPKEAWAEIG